MAWVADTLGYEDWDGNRYEGVPDTPDGAAGIWVHSYDNDTGQEEYTWIWTYDPFGTWDEWVIHTTLVLEGHGIALA